MLSWYLQVLDRKKCALLMCKRSVRADNTERLYPVGGASRCLAPCSSAARCDCPAAPCCCQEACAAASPGWTSGSPWQHCPGQRIYSSRIHWALLLLHCHTKGLQCCYFSKVDSRGCVAEYVIVMHIVLTHWSLSLCLGATYLKAVIPECR